jgi:Spy/CpxP family protein refolding chaperone
MNSKKQLLVVLAMVATLGLVTVQSADARGKGRWESGYGCNNYEVSERWDEGTREARTKFHQENKALRRDLITKNAELRAIMQQDNPDAGRAGKLSAEIFDLRETLHQKAVAAGLPGQRFQKGACGGPDCRGPFAGETGKHGRGYGPRAMWN